MFLNCLTMERIHNRANKFIKDVHKKKLNVGKNIYNENERGKQDVINISDLTNICHYCQKVFFNSKFLIRHILRRHSEDLILLHKKCLKLETNNNSNNLQYLISYLEEEFLALKNELTNVKRAVSGTTVVNDMTVPENNIDSVLVENVCVNGVNNSKINEITSEIDAKEFHILKEKICAVENNVHSLSNKFEELNHILQNNVLMKHDVDELQTLSGEKLLRAQEKAFLELRDGLFNELQSELSKHLSSNDNEWRSQIAELKHEIKKLDWIIGDIKKQVYSPDYIKILKEKLEHEILYFLDTNKHKSRKEKHFKSKSMISKFPIHSSPKENRVVEYGKLNTKTVSLTKPKQIPAISDISSNEILFMLTEKLSYFNISPNTSKISCAEFEEKLKLINSEKEHLSKKYPNFSEIFRKINMQADHKVHNKLHSKRSRKIRFSDPLILSADELYDTVSNNEKLHNITHPFIQTQSEYFNTLKKQKNLNHESREFSDINTNNFPASGGFCFPGGGGDCSRIFHGSQNHFTKEAAESISVKSGFKSSSPTRISLMPEKSKNMNTVFPSSSKALDATAELSDDTCYSTKNDPELNKESFFANKFKNSNEAVDTNSITMDDFENSSLESLSSWES